MDQQHHSPRDLGRHELDRAEEEQPLDAPKGFIVKRDRRSSSTLGESQHANERERRERWPLE